MSTAVRQVDSTILDLRLALLNPKLRGERRTLIEGELEALRLARIGVRVKGQRSYLRRLGLLEPRRLR